MSVKLSKVHHRTLVISARPWFYFLLNIGLNPDVFFVVNRCSDSGCFWEWNHACDHILEYHWSSVPLACLLGHLDLGTFSSCSYAHSRSNIKDVWSYLKFIIGYQYLQNHQIWVWDSLFLFAIHPQQLAHTLLCSLEPSLVSKQLWMTSGVSVSLTVISQHIKNTLYTLYNIPSSSGMQFLAIYFSV